MRPSCVNNKKSGRGIVYTHDMSDLTPLLGAIAGGLFPALAWLWFWRREDAPHPEPRRLIALAFFAGMLTVALVIPMQQCVAGSVQYSFLPMQSACSFLASFLPTTTAIFIAWSTIEEVMKYLLARITVLRSREDDEPIDPVIYMVAVALGFAAAENTLFLISPLAGDSLLQTIMTGNLRFVGATLLHVLASAVIGVAIALAFYGSPAKKRLFTTLGVILACVLHSMFNFLILNTAEEYLLRTFGIVWLGLILLLAVLEYVKRIHPKVTRSFP